MLCYALSLMSLTNSLMLTHYGRAAIRYKTLVYNLGVRMYQMTMRRNYFYTHQQRGD